jgi:hypothetical protein
MRTALVLLSLTAWLATASWSSFAQAKPQEIEKIKQKILREFDRRLDREFKRLRRTLKRDMERALTQQFAAIRKASPRPERGRISGAADQEEADRLARRLPRDAGR